MQNYYDMGVQIADASLCYLAEIYNLDVIFTLDRKEKIFQSIELKETKPYELFLLNKLCDFKVMTTVKPERITQNRVIKLFTEELGYQYLGNWQDRHNNSNIETKYITEYLTKVGYSTQQIDRSLDILSKEANNLHRTLYENNKAVYSLLRYGVQVKTEIDKNTETVKLINWDAPEKNHWAIAEEVTLKGNKERRPDLVLYLNGIAIGVMELKKSTVSIGEGIRQNISNQKKEFNEWFFSTVQILIAGNNSQGLKYGAIATAEKYYLSWKEDIEDNRTNKLDKYLIKLCHKKRLLELIYDFMLFDGGVKKLPRFHQYFAIKEAQKNLNEKKGGIIWHTQGSGKSIVMVLLAKWILENNPHARIIVVTDRYELDKQIEGIFKDAGETIHRSNSGRDLINQLSQAKPRLLCSLIHKFGKKNVNDFDQFIQDLEAQPSPAVGDLYVFVDECHRTQSGKFHRTMKAILPNAIFIGFTGTPLLKQDKQSSKEVFGDYIHTYKFSEAVEDEIILDLVYEARDIEQQLSSQDRIDKWFDAKTKGLNEWQKARLRQQWGTMQKVLSSKSRMNQVVNDIIFDFSVKPRLSDDRGTAILVASSIYEACKYYQLFQQTELKDKCAVITSYNPQSNNLSTEDTGANSETDKQLIYNTYHEILKNITSQPQKTKTETYEDIAKKKFKDEPANMKLLIVVNKLLTGFDAPSCTYIYLDQSMQDHGLFQAICRTNRLDGEDKTFGYVIDYKDLFKKVEKAIAVYTSELDFGDNDSDPQIILQDRFIKAKELLDDALEAIYILCEPVETPKTEAQYIHYFCGNTEIPEDLKEKEYRRGNLYRQIASLIRAYGNIADELDKAGYSKDEIHNIKTTVKNYIEIREVIRNASGETLDLKAYETDMRHLIDTYIEAQTPRKISAFDDLSLVDLIVKSGINQAINELPEGIKKNKATVAETIENNIRRLIVQEQLNDPAYYNKMSTLLDELIATRKQKAIEYEELLKHYAQLAQKVKEGKDDDTPKELNTSAKLALYNNLKALDSKPTNRLKEPSATYQIGDDKIDPMIKLALDIDEAVKRVKPADWRGEKSKENVIKEELLKVLKNITEVERIFLIIKEQKEY